MPRIQIKSLEERVATAGLHMGGGPERRKLEPYEVVDIPEDMTLPDGRNLLDVLWETNKVELTLAPVTRPLDYASYREGRLCGPNFKPRGPGEETERDAAVERVADRLAEQAEAEEVEAPAETKPTQREATAKPVATNKRATRRRGSKARAKDNGEAHIT